MKDNITCLGQKTGDAGMTSPRMALKDAMDSLGEAGAFRDGKKLLVLGLDDTSENFAVSFIQAGMTMSQCVALCEVAKSIFLKEMNYS